ncbi:hypothetical protein DKT77_19315 [Meridianimarinicoccus roseus]|uniref:Uncharacterized protein n=1 Tax=Meridianimarinicoccus roseus TaxID=2072018 RepID=A0A2V2L7A6_9RHOB|nr:hypothetical protein [Meridianimarinicoccus roseus]PWR00995.1 hypothetical protein DKT77_19315 [Meridianimarinicoccus roseus]
MSANKRKYAEALDTIQDHDSWNYRLPKLARMSQVKLEDIDGVIQFDGQRNPSSRSATSNKIFFTYKTAANEWLPKVGIAESAAEAAVGLQLVMSKNVFDVEFQPLTIKYNNHHGHPKLHTFDLRVTFNNGYRRLLFVRYRQSLERPSTIRQIQQIIDATSGQEADDIMIVNADQYSRQRRDNIFRMHHFVFHPDAEADEELMSAGRRLTSLYFMKDLFPHVSVSAPRAFAACNRLVAKKFFRANLDNVLWENSHLELVE